MTATQKRIEIEVASSFLTFLRNNAYKLCFAKKVNNTFDVVWQSFSEYLEMNIFQWTPVYQLFGSNTFQGNLTVEVATNVVNIDLGQTATLSSAGVLGDASTGGPSTGITMVNNWSPIYPGLNQMSTGPGGIQETTPIYVSTAQIAKGSDVLTPVEEIMVWFGQNIQTSTMFSGASANAVIIDMTSSNLQTRLYSNGRWSTPR